MRNIGQLATEPAARKLGDFLYLRGIRNEVEAETDGRWSLWILEDDQVPAARQFLERFLANAAAPEFQVDTRKSSALRDQELAQADEAAKRQWGRERIFPEQAVITLGMVSIALVILCTAIFLISDMGKNDQVLSPLKISEQPGGARDLPPTHWLPETKHGQIWRLFTPALIHFSFLHIFFNMLWLKDLGSLIETRLGSLYLLLLILAIAVGSNLAQYWWTGPNFGGMSGVVYGLFGYIWIRGRRDPASGLFIDKQTVIFMLIWLVVSPYLIGNIANAVHAAGLLLGALLGFLTSHPTRRRR